MIWTLISCTR